jgi:hypothetical protein
VGLKDKLYVIDGFVGGWTPTDDVHEYDPASDRWQQFAALPTLRGALAAAVLDRKIHAVGGVGWRGRNTPAHEVYGGSDTSLKRSLRSCGRSMFWSRRARIWWTQSARSA